MIVNQATTPALKNNKTMIYNHFVFNKHLMAFAWDCEGYKTIFKNLMFLLTRKVG